MNYKLYALTYCPFCQKVINFMNKNNLNDRVEILYKDKNPEYEQALIEGGGSKQVPCLQYDDQWLYESDDIIAYFKEHLL